MSNSITSEDRLPQLWPFHSTHTLRPNEQFWTQRQVLKPSAMSLIDDYDQCMSGGEVDDVSAADIVRVFHTIPRMRKMLAIRNERGLFGGIGMEEIERWSLDGLCPISCPKCRQNNGSVTWSVSSISDVKTSRQISIMSEKSAILAPQPTPQQTQKGSPRRAAATSKPSDESLNVVPVPVVQSQIQGQFQPQRVGRRTTGRGVSVNPSTFSGNFALLLSICKSSTTPVSMKNVEINDPLVVNKHQGTDENTFGPSLDTHVFWYRNSTMTANIDILRDLCKVVGGMSVSDVSNMTAQTQQQESDMPKAVQQSQTPRLSKVILVASLKPKQKNIVALAREYPAVSIEWWSPDFFDTDWFSSRSVFPLAVHTHGGSDCGHFPKAQIEHSSSCDYHARNPQDECDSFTLDMLNHIEKCTGMTKAMLVEREVSSRVRLGELGIKTDGICGLCTVNIMGSLGFLAKSTELETRQLPAMMTDDIVCRVMDLSPGDVVVSYREGMRTFRCVVPRESGFNTTLTETNQPTPVSQSTQSSNSQGQAPVVVDKIVELTESTGGDRIKKRVRGE